MEFSFTERGNFAFRNDEGSAVIFAKHTPEDMYIQAAFTPVNYPAWNVGTVFLHGDELVDHIHDNLGGWYADKCTEEVNLDGRFCVIDSATIVEEVVDLVIKQANDAAYNPTQTYGALEDAIKHCANTLGYFLTTKMFVECQKHACDMMDFI